MALKLLHSEFPYIWGKFNLIFYQCRAWMSARGECSSAASVSPPSSPQVRYLGLRTWRKTNVKSSFLITTWINWEIGHGSSLVFVKKLAFQTKSKLLAQITVNPLSFYSLYGAVWCWGVPGVGGLFTWDWVCTAAGFFEYYRNFLVLHNGRGYSQLQVQY